MVIVNEGGGLREARVVRNLRGGGRVGEVAAAVVVVERARAVAQDEEVGTSVVVVVARDGGGGDSVRVLRERARTRGHVRELASVVVVEARTAARNFQKVELAVAVVVEEHDRAAALFEEVVFSGPRAAPVVGGSGGRQHGGGHVFEDDIGRAFVNEFRLSARGGDGLCVAPLFEVVLPDGRRRAALAQALELLHQALPFFALP